MITLAKANILQAFDHTAVGSRVVRHAAFLRYLLDAIKVFDFNSETNPKVTTTGQGVVPMPAAAFDSVSAGVGPHVDDVNAYVLRSWRGKVGSYLKRQYAAPVESLAVVVYTVEAYLADPDVAGDSREVARIKQEAATHVAVAVLAGAGPKPPAYTVRRLVANLAGGNKDALAWDADTIREKATEANAYASEWGVVAD
jgi:hypothetical protein